MTLFSVGDNVIVRFGIQQGQKGVVIGSQTAHVYKVRIEDGSVLYFSWQGLEKKNEKLRQAV